MPRAKAKMKLKAKRAKNKASGSSSKSHTASRKWDYIPRLVVFDLDFTLWYPEMYELWGAPFKKTRQRGRYGLQGGASALFRGSTHGTEHFGDGSTVPRHDGGGGGFADDGAQVGQDLHAAHGRGYRRLSSKDMKEEESEESEENDDEEDEEEEKKSLLSIVDYEAIYPRNKRVHFEQLKKDSGIPYEDMLFFDNEYGNVHDIQKLGVTCAYCPQGLTEGSWIQGMEGSKPRRGSKPAVN
ncbi:Magnesium-dependent phosphatase-1, eukaryotic type [Phytophthora cactorum]|nr:Magnesium-dependent phosphatase-1, eukaryotic type [Phytophthora cactorum]